MKYILSALIVLTILLVVEVNSSYCYWCPTYECYSSDMCGSDCVCIKYGSSYKGKCASIN